MQELLENSALPPPYVGFPPRRPARSNVVDSSMDCVRLGRSCLHGRGVFAVHDLAALTYLGDYQGLLQHSCPNDRAYVMRVTVD